MKKLLLASMSLVVIACSGNDSNPTSSSPTSSSPTSSSTASTDTSTSSSIETSSSMDISSAADASSSSIQMTSSSSADLGQNLALNKETLQSTTAYAGLPEYAVDGNTDGAFRSRSVSHTDDQAQPWWQVDLGASETISHINIFNRTDRCCAGRLANFYVMLSDTPFASSELNASLLDETVTSYYFESQVPGSMSFEVSGSARFVRVQLATAEGSLNLAEVEVIQGGELPDGLWTSSPIEIELTGDAARGKTLYESNEQGCLRCHGSYEEPTTRPIDIDKTDYVQGGISHTLASYNELFMPPSDPSICDEQCGLDIAAYIGTWGANASDGGPLFSATVRLTNDEYASALADLVLPENDERVLQLKQVELSKELEVGGLVSAEERQQLSQLTFSRFLEAAKEAANLRLLGDQSGPLTEDNFNEYILCADTSLSQNDCIRERGLAYIERGFRGQGNTTDIQDLEALLAAIDALPNEGTVLERLVLRYQSVVQFIALSPKFVMLLEKGIAAQDQGSQRPLTQQEIANRLAFCIAGTPPDSTLIDAADQGLLSSADARKTQASRLISEATSAIGAEKIVMSWLGLNPTLATEEAIAETQAFVKTWIAERRPFSDLYTAPVAVENVDAQVTQEPFGILGLEAVLASHTNDPVPSFINRGEFIVADLLCGQLPEDVPDEAIGSTVEDPIEVFEIHDKEPCATCHVVFDNYGAALQRFDVTTLQYDPNNDWLGTNFELFPVGDVSGSVTTAGDLGAVLGASQQAHSCFAELWYRHATRRDMLIGLDTADDAILGTIVEQWMGGDSSVASLLELIAQHESFATLYH